VTEDDKVEVMAKKVALARARSEQLEEERDALRVEVGRLAKRFRAPIVCMCGSTRFKQAWITENARLTGEGNIVLAVGLWGGHHERRFPDAKTKEALDELHKRKIDLCDWVWVLDVGGYIDSSTRSEIAYARNLDKPVRYLSREYSHYIEPEGSLSAEVGRLRQLLKDLWRESGPAFIPEDIARRVEKELEV
jgi:hypothetical protein